MKKLFICEKPSQTKLVLKTLGEDNDVAIISPSIAAYKFDYLRSIPYKNIPITKTPEYKQQFPKYGNYGKVYFIDNEKVNIKEQEEIKELYDCISYLTGSHKSGKIYKENDLFEIKNTVKEYIESFDEIIYACDPDYTGVRGFTLLFKMFFGYHEYKRQLAYKKIKISYLEINSLDEKFLKESYDKRTDLILDESFSNLIESYKKKDLFEYSFNLNSMVLFGDILRNIGIYEEVIITKNMLLTLMLISNSNKLTESDLIHNMTNSNIGSPVSRTEIITKLYDIGLIYFGTYKKNKRDVRYHILTKEGELFLENIHPKVKDPKMSVKLEDKIYGNLTAEEFKVDVEEKMDIMFSKQKRFFRKKLREQLEL